MSCTAQWRELIREMLGLDSFHVEPSRSNDEPETGPQYS